MPVENLSASLQLIGNYDLVEKIAEGGMGAVYKGRHRATGELVAIKVFRAVSKWSDPQRPNDLGAPDNPNTLGYRCKATVEGDQAWRMTCRRLNHTIVAGFAT